jgi:WD40 repeat protein
MSSRAACSICGAGLRRDAPEGLCPACLLQLAVRVGASDPKARAARERPAADAGSRSGIRYFGDYEVYEELARGGMGIVFRARQVSLDRPVALKMILAGKLATPAQLTRFYSEAAAAAKLDHPNIVPIYEVGEHHGQHFYSMRLIEGGTLAGRTLPAQAPDTSGPAGEKFGSQYCANLICQVAHAVHFAHRHGILHRDLKPTNVLLDKNDKPYVTDFGLAKVAGDDLGLTQSAAVLGTPAYMAPEQASGSARQLTTAADIYSLGAILYELLTGRPPFVADTPLAAMRKVIDEKPVAPRRLARLKSRPEVDKDLETICLKCLRKDPQSRYRSAQALAEDLERWLAGEPILARPASGPERFRLWCKRKPLVAGLWGSLALALAAGAVGVLWQWRRAAQSASEARQAETRARDELWRAELERARAQRRTGEEGQSALSLEAAARAARIRPGLESRNEAIAALALTDLQFVPIWTNFTTFFLARFSPSVERAAVTLAGGGVRLLRTGDGREESVLPSIGTAASRLSFSPDERLLAVNYASGSNVVWDLATQSPRLAWGPSPVAGEFTPDGGYVLKFENSGVLSCVALRDQQERWHCQTGRGLWSLNFQPEGKYFAAYYLQSPVVEVRSLDTGELVRTLTHPSDLTSLAWSPNGKTLAAGVESGRIFTWDITSAAEPGNWRAQDDSVVALGFAPSGRWLITAGWDGSIRLWTLPECRLAVVGRGYTPLYQVQFDPDERWLGCGRRGKVLGLIRISPSTVLRRIHVPPGEKRGAWSLDVSHDGRLMAAAYSDGLRVFELATGSEVARLTDEHFFSALFTTDGAALITCGLSGIARWPLERIQNGSANGLRLGARQSIREGLSLVFAALSADGRWLAAANQRAACVAVYDMSQPTNRFALTEHRAISQVALSPDGRWVASGTWNGRGVKIWALASKGLVRELPVTQTARVTFSPDSRLLVTGSESYQVWDTASWNELYQGPDSENVYRPSAFSPDGGALAVVKGQSVIELLDPASGRVLADLEAPGSATISWLRFSPDGSALLALEWARDIQVWDLRQLREKLGSLNLDWDAPRHLPQHAELPASR